MAWNSREGAPYSLRTVLKQLDDRGIELPDTVTEKVARLERIEAERPAEPEHTALHDAILAGADRAELDRLLLDELGSQRLRSSYAQATLTAASSGLSALRKARDEIHPQLAELADDAINKLCRIEALGSVSLDQLVRTGRHEEARLYADRELIGAELHTLYEIRDLYLVPGGTGALNVGHFNCGQWRDPTAVSNHLHGQTVSENYILGLRAGGVLWYPTLDEAVEAAGPLYEAWEREARKAAERQRSVGGITAFG